MGGRGTHSLAGEGQGEPYSIGKELYSTYNPSTVVNKIFYLLSGSKKKTLLVRYR
jgi:hypothetical protein